MLPGFGQWRRWVTSLWSGAVFCPWPGFGTNMFQAASLDCSASLLLDFFRLGSLTVFGPINLLEPKEFVQAPEGGGGSSNSSKS